MRLAVLVGEPGFVFRVAFAFLGRLAEVEGLQAVGHVAGQRVAHLEEEVGALAGQRLQQEAVAGPTLIVGCVGSQFGRAHLNPNKLPVEHQFIGHLFARQKSRVLGRTLCLGRGGNHAQ